MGEFYVCWLCGATFTEEPAAISGMRAIDETSCGPCYELEEADSDELEGLLAYLAQRR
jgi:hypothetical protein